MATSILLELQYLPPISYFSKLVQYKNVWIEQHEHYQKRSYRNRCHIVGANGLLRLSIPLQKGKNEQLPIREVQLSYDEPWTNQHWQSIRSAYGRAPFFEFYAEEIAPFFEKRYTYLFDFNWALLQKLIEVLGIPSNIRLTETYKKETPAAVLDFRNNIQPKQQNSDLNFQSIPYVQVFQNRHGFLKDLSILDLLFCTGPEAILYLESQN